MSNDTQVKQEAAKLPEWTECQSMFADGSGTPLTEFIRAYEPVGPEADQWRVDFADLLATVRREVWNEAIRVAQMSTKKSQAAGLDIAAAEILIRRLERASAKQ